MKKISIVLALVGSFSSQVFAEQVGAWSLGAEAGYSDARSANLKNAGACDPETTLGCVIPSGSKLNDLDSSSNFGLALGYRLSKEIRFELAANVRNGFELNGTRDWLDSNDRSSFKADVKSSAVMVNAIYIIPVSSFEPYVGAGIGYARNRVSKIKQHLVDTAGLNPDLDIVDHGGVKHGFAWQLMAGVDYPVNDHVTFGAGYRYVDLGEIKTNVGVPTYDGIASPENITNGTKGDLRAQELNLSVRYAF